MSQQTIQEKTIEAVEQEPLKCPLKCPQCGATNEHPLAFGPEIRRIWNGERIIYCSDCDHEQPED